MATKTAPPNPHQTPLSFPAPVFAAFTPSAFLLAHLQPTTSTPPSRPNTRTPQQPRPLALNTSALTHSSGSSVARLGGTAAVAGIRAEILHARNIPEPPAIDLDAPDTDDPSAPLEPDFALPIVVPNIEIAGAAPGLVAGQAPSSRAQALAARVLSLLHLTRVIRASDLRITRKAVNEDGEEEEVLAGYWVLYIDVHVISADGNVFDAIWFAILGALRNARLPRAAWNSDSESVICDADPASLRPLRLRGNPVAASFAVFEPALEKGLRDEKGVWVLNDPDGFEEGVCNGQGVTVVVDNGVVRRVEGVGVQGLGGGGVEEVVRLAVERWSEWIGAVGVGGGE